MQSELDTVEQTILNIIQRGDFQDQRRKVTRWFNEFVHPDDYDYYRPLYNNIMSMINESELKDQEQTQVNLDLLDQRNEALSKLEEAEHTIRERDVKIRELENLIVDYFAKLAAGLDADVSWESGE